MEIQLVPSGDVFACDPRETLLEAALRSGLSLEYGCNDGRCGECKARILKGQLGAERFHDYSLSSMERSQGMVLLCCASPATDLVIEVALRSIQEIPQQRIEGKISRVERVRADVMELHVRTPRSQALRFMAGQAMQVQFEGVPPAVLPIASCPCNGQVLHFHIQQRSHDPFTEYVFHRLKNRQDVVLTGPHGRFTLDDDSSRPIIFLAYDLGFSYIKSLVEHAIALDLPQSMYFYWWSGHAEGHYLANYCRAWADALDNFRVELLHHPGGQPESCLEQSIAWLDQQHPDLVEYDIYLTMPPQWVNWFKPALLQQGFPTERLFIAPPLAD